MNLKYLGSESEFHEGYGAGDGTIDTTIYECPCGEGKVEYVKDNIPGFRDSEVNCYCDKCKLKYSFEKGTATELNN